MQLIVDLERSLQDALNAIRPGVNYIRYLSTEGSKWAMGPHVRVYVPRLPSEKGLPRKISKAIATVINQRLVPVHPRIRKCPPFTNKLSHSFNLELTGKWP